MPQGEPPPITQVYALTFGFNSRFLHFLESLGIDREGDKSCAKIKREGHKNPRKEPFANSHPGGVLTCRLGAENKRANHRRRESVRATAGSGAGPSGP